MKKSAKVWVIVLCAIVGLAAIGTTAALLVTKVFNPSSYTVHFELCTDLQTTAVNDREVEAGALLEEPEVYVTGDNSENWVITGWYRDKDFKSEWDFDFDTVESDLTLYAKWGTNPQCTINFWTLDSDKAIYTTQIRKGLTISPCDDKFIGREVLGYYTDQDMQNEFDFDMKVEENLDLWVKVSDYVYFSPEAIMKMDICGNQVEVTEYEATKSITSEGDLVTIGGKDGAYFWIKNLDLAMNGTSIIQIKARELNDNYNGVLAGYITGNYTLNGEAGAAGDFGEQYTGAMLFGKSAKPDEDGFYTYTYNLSALAPDIIYEKMTGFRISIFGTDKYAFEIKEIKSYVDEYAVSGDAFLAKDGINFNALHLNTFTLMGDAQTEMIGKELLSFGGPNGAYIYRKELNISMGDEQIVRVKAKGDLKGGSLVMFFYGDYTINGKAGSIGDFDGKHSVTFIPESTDANGFTTYVADIGSAISGLKYKTIKGFRLDLYGEGTRTLQLQSVISKAPTAEEKQIAADFNGKGINFKGAHLNKFLTLGGAEKKLLSNGNLRFGGPNGAFIYNKSLNITMGDEQIIRVKAKGDLKGGSLAMFFYGNYTQNGKKVTKTDFTSALSVFLVPESTDAQGYTTYVADLSSISGFKLDTLKGLRFDLYGEGTRTLEIVSVKSYALSEEDIQVNKDFNATDGIHFKGMHFSKFNVAGDAQTALKSNGDFTFGGPNGAMLYYKNLNITMGDEQIIKLKAKGDLKGGAVALFFYGDYTQDGQPDAKTDFDGEHSAILSPESTDVDGYTTYVIDMGAVKKGLKYQTIKGLRLDLWGDGTRTLEIASMDSVAPSQQDEETNEGFSGAGINWEGKHLSKFMVGTLTPATTDLLENGDFKFSGDNGAFIYKKQLENTLAEDQMIEMKAKADLKGGLIAIYIYGNYTENGQPKETTDFGPHTYIMEAGEIDSDGYTTFTADLTSEYPGVTWQTIKGYRIELWGAGNKTLEIKSVKSYAPIVTPPANPDEPDQPEEPVNFKLTPEDLDTFEEVNVTTEITAAGDFKMSGTNGAHVYKKDLNYLVPDSQMIEMKAKADLKGGIVAVYLYGNYTDGTPQETTDFGVSYQLTAGETDSDGYTTFTLDLTSGSPNVTWQTIKGYRIEMWGGNQMTLEIKSVEAAVLVVTPPVEPDEEYIVHETYDDGVNGWSGGEIVDGELSFAGSEQLTYTITGLTPGTSYTISFAAHEANGWNVIDVYTEGNGEAHTTLGGDGSLSTKTTYTHTFTAGSSSATFVVWTSASPLFIDDFKVYEAEETDEEYIVHETYDDGVNGWSGGEIVDGELSFAGSEQLTYTITGLTPGTTYTISFAAHEANGWNVIDVYTEGNGEAHTTLGGDGSLSTKDTYTHTFTAGNSTATLVVWTSATPLFIDDLKVYESSKNI